MIKIKILPTLYILLFVLSLSAFASDVGNFEYLENDYYNSVLFENSIITVTDDDNEVNTYHASNYSVGTAVEGWDMEYWNIKSNISEAVNFGFADTVSVVNWSADMSSSPKVKRVVITVPVNIAVPPTNAFEFNLFTLHDYNYSDNEMNPIKLSNYKVTFNVTDSNNNTSNIDVSDNNLLNSYKSYSSQCVEYQKANDTLAMKGVLSNFYVYHSFSNTAVNVINTVTFDLTFSSIMTSFPLKNFKYGFMSHQYSYLLGLSSVFYNRLWNTTANIGTLKNSVVNIETMLEDYIDNVGANASVVQQIQQTLNNYSTYITEPSEEDLQILEEMKQMQIESSADLEEFKAKSEELTTQMEAVGLIIPTISGSEGSLTSDLQTTMTDIKNDENISAIYSSIWNVPIVQTLVLVVISLATISFILYGQKAR